MRWFQRFICLLSILIAASAQAQTDGDTAPQTDYPEIEAFAERLTGVIWDLRGTSSLKALSYDGTAMAPIARNGKAGNHYETSFLDEGVVRLNFKAEHTGWYFFSDNFKYVTSVNAVSEISYQIAKDSTPKRISQFPGDITNLVFESIEDERKLNPTRLRWNGTEVEFASQVDGAWTVRKVSPFVANRRVFELSDTSGPVVWLVFSADGKEAWLLEISGVFGGHARDNPAVAKTTPAESGLSPTQNDLANHAEDLAKAGETVLLGTLDRLFGRLLKDDQKALSALRARLK